MSVMLNFAMFPTDKGTSVSEYVAKVLAMVRESGVSYKLNPMGTTIETESIAQALAIVQQAHDILEPHADRIYTAITIDSKKSELGRMNGKIKSVEDKIGKLNQ